MQVAGDACAGGFSQVHAEVDAVGAVGLSKDVLQPLRQRHHLLRFAGLELAEFRSMGVGQDHDVAGTVRKCIQADKAELSAIENVGGAVGFGGWQSIFYGVG